MLESINRFDDCYEVIKRKKNSKIISFIVILIVVLIIFLMYFFLYPYNKIKTYYGSVIKIDDSIYVSIKVSNVNYLYDKSTILKIDNKIVNYEIVDVINNYDYNDIILKLQLNLEPKIIKLKFILPKKTLFERLKEDLYE